MSTYNFCGGSARRNSQHFPQMFLLLVLIIIIFFVGQQQANGQDSAGKAKKAAVQTKSSKESLTTGFDKAGEQPDLVREGSSTSTSKPGPRYSDKSDVESHNFYPGPLKAPFVLQNYGDSSRYLPIYNPDFFVRPFSLRNKPDSTSAFTLDRKRNSKTLKDNNKN
jgi:hypothetical protein